MQSLSRNIKTSSQNWSTNRSSSHQLLYHVVPQVEKVLVHVLLKEKILELLFPHREVRKVFLAISTDQMNIKIMVIY